MTRKEALDVLRKNIPTDKSLPVYEALQTLIPELRESEDEKMWKLIKKYAHYNISDMALNADHITRKELEDWLEKQKECVADNSNTSESEDERIRKELVEYHKQQFENNRDQEVGLFHKDALTYLEKQKEQKPVEPSDDELQRHQKELHNFKVFAAKQAKEHHISFVHDFEWNNFCGEILSYFNEQKPAWSEEDEDMIQDIIASIDTNIAASDFHEMEAWLKSLRPSWKPSEEQMEALNKARRFIPYNCDILESLYNQLKKL